MKNLSLTFCLVIATLSSPVWSETVCGLEHNNVLFHDRMIITPRSEKKNCGNMWFGYSRNLKNCSDHMICCFATNYYYEKIPKNLSVSKVYKWYLWTHS